MAVEIVGIGSRVRADDAIGLHLVEGLAGRPGLRTHLWEDRDALDLATLLLELDRPVLVVDCARMGLEPGAWRAFDAEDADLRQHARSVSTHGLGLADALALAKDLGFGRPVRIFGVQPFDLSLRSGLSPGMAGALAVLREAFWEEVSATEQLACHGRGRVLPERI